MVSPYADLDQRAFWRTGVSSRSPLDPGDLYRPKFRLDKSAKITTAGSCFAQHIGRTLRHAGLAVVDEEPLPTAVSDKVANKFGYRLFSARYGNVYTARQLLQLHKEAYDEFEPQSAIWEKNGVFFDALRPSVEPHGLQTTSLVEKHRQAHLYRAEGIRKAR